MLLKGINKSLTSAKKDFSFSSNNGALKKKKTTDCCIYILLDASEDNTQPPEVHFLSTETVDKR